MNALETNVIYYGWRDPLPDQLPLRAGPLRLIYYHGDLRYIRLGQHEIVRRIYAAVRDENWNTIPFNITEHEVTVHPDAFSIRFLCTHQQGTIGFAWRGLLEGSADGSLSFSFDGEPLSIFKRNRIGICVLHPAALAGQAVTVQHVDGRQTEGHFPIHIAPHQPFLQMRAITHEIMHDLAHEGVPGLRAEVRMTGDIFEMEDQRNWTDASYKTYSTPLELPMPVEVGPGEIIYQEVTLRLHGEVPAAIAEEAEPPLTFSAGEPLDHGLPRIGLGVASHNGSLSFNEIKRLRALNLSHLRVDLYLDQVDAPILLRWATDQARAIGAALEIALHVTDEAQDELDTLSFFLDDINPPVEVWLIFKQGAAATPSELVALARDVLGLFNESARFGGGTDGFFTDLNRARVPFGPVDHGGFDVVSYSVNPQVHAFDNLSLAEALETQAVTVRSARQFVGDAEIAVSPVTLKPRDAAPNPSDDLPGQVCVRQMSLFGAGWTLGSLKYLAEAGAERATYYETTGWRGVMETSSGSVLPDTFCSVPGGAFPMYHVLADVGEYRDAELIASRSSHPLRVDGLILRRDGQMRVLLANLTSQVQAVRLVNLPESTATLVRLNAERAEEAMRQPETFRERGGQPLSIGADGLRLELAPYAVVRLDIL